MVGGQRRPPPPNNSGCPANASQKSEKTAHPFFDSLASSSIYTSLVSSGGGGVHVKGL